MTLELVENHIIREDLYNNKVLKKDNEIDSEERNIIKKILLNELK